MKSILLAALVLGQMLSHPPARAAVIAIMPPSGPDARRDARESGEPGEASDD